MATRFCDLMSVPVETIIIETKGSETTVQQGFLLLYQKTSEGRYFLAINKGGPTS